MTGFLNNPAGGWRYHWRALKYGNNLWHPYKLHVAEFLKQWSPPNEELIIVGPSAGYSLPLDWLTRFRSLEILEPDPIARVVFNARAQYSGLQNKLKLSPDDLFIANPSLESFHSYLTNRPHAAILFTNFLGQVPLLFEHSGATDRLTQFQAQLGNVLNHRTWASYHDYFSVEHDRNVLAPDKIFVLNGPTPPVPIDELVKFFGLANSGNSKLEVLDHDTNRLFPNSHSRRYFLWQLTPTRVHVIEAITNT